MIIIQIQSTTELNLNQVMEPARAAMNDICCGLDDMHFLGKKALVLRSEIFPPKIEQLKSRLKNEQINVIQVNLPPGKSIKDDKEYIVTLQIISTASNTDGKSSIPNVPG